MGKHVKGFWSDRPRAGQADARLLAAERMHAVRHTPFPELLGKAGAPAEVEVVTGPDGAQFRRRTKIRRFRRAGQEELAITVRVDRGTFFGGLNPLAEELVLATPDGEMVGDYTMASEGNDPRRYRFRGD